MENNNADQAQSQSTIVCRALALTDEAWRANAAGREFDFRRVEMGFEALLASVATMELDPSLERDPVVSNILRVLSSSNVIARRYDHRHAFDLLVRAAGPITDKAKCLDTAKR
ncbi:hypothetical protein [Maricaulis alexandrii]|uniref:hypothetical protein n=1 Tax=Maricaulis alexandrii TaxID=2570354 RepID=UPI001108175E|nr:hypothetical protein [Maricaulis alexandrii]